MLQRLFAHCRLGYGLEDGDHQAFARRFNELFCDRLKLIDCTNGTVGFLLRFAASYAMRQDRKADPNERQEVGL